MSVLWSLAACLNPRAGVASETAMNWPAVLSLANEHLITPVLHRSLSGCGAVPDEVRDYLGYIHLMNCRRNRIIRRQAMDLVRAFNRAGIVPLLLKGVLLAVADRQFGVGTRMMADIDVLVPAEAAERAIEVLSEEGYAVRNPYPAGHHATAEFARDGSPAAIDLHVQLVDQRYILPAAEVWRDAQPARMANGARFLYPSATHRVLHNILHAEIHYRGGFYLAEVDLRQLYELAYLARADQGAIDWRMIERRMEGHRLTIPLQSYLWNAHLLMGMDWPLDRRPSRRAVFHAWRCRLQAEHAALRRAALPWANLRAAFAWHRMAWLHGWAGGEAMRWRYAHLRYVLQRHSTSFVVQKLLKL